MSNKGLTLVQRVAFCFVAGVIGGLAVVMFSHVLFGVGLSGALGVKAPVPLSPPGIYRLLFWGGLWGIPFGIFIKTAWKGLYLFGLLYFLAPVLATFLIFLPMHGAGYFGLQAGRADVHGLPAGGKSAVRDNHRFGCKGAHRGGAIRVLRRVGSISPVSTIAFSEQQSLSGITYLLGLCGDLVSFRVGIFALGLLTALSGFLLPDGR